MSEASSSEYTDTLSIDEEAALWFTRQHSQLFTEQQASEFTDWLAASAEHKQAYKNIAEVWRDCDLMPRPVSLPMPPQKRTYRWLWRPLGNTLAGLFIVALLFMPYSHLPSMLINNMTLVTRDQPKEMILSDGSRLFLNRNSQIRVAYKKEQRQLWLDQGEVFFSVKSNPYRPFIIHADQRDIQVVGTEFSVSKEQSQIEISVNQGVVAFQTAQQNKKQYLYAGDNAVSSAPDSKILVSKIATQDIAGWRYGELNFTERPLGEILRQLKPYYDVNIELSPQDLMQRKISGRINLQQPEQFFQALPLLLPVQVVFKDQNNILIIEQQTGLSKNKVKK